jgi:hypothetical protein
LYSIQTVENQIDGRPENLESGASLPVLSKDRGCTLTETEVDTQIIKYRAMVERMFGEGDIDCLIMLFEITHFCH